VDRILPLLVNTFSGIAVRASNLASQESLARFKAAGALVHQAASEEGVGGSKLGIARQEAIKLALAFDPPNILYCDCDRILHWAEYFPEELVRILRLLSEHDFTILGRTERAFASHPRVQRDMEAIINHVVVLLTGQQWDLMAGARGLSQAAARAIVKDCLDEEISVDVSWPLFLRSIGGFRIGYIATEGLEFETLDRYPEEVAAAGGLEAWKAQVDADVGHWLHRLEYIRAYVKAIRSYGIVDPSPNPRQG
jgi:hypothetical protein